MFLFSFIYSNYYCCGYVCVCFCFFPVKSYYLEAYVAMKLMLKQPHLVIYLDIPVDIVQKRIKSRNRDWEVNSPVLNEKYLSTIEKYYKLNFLKEMR